MLKSDNCVKNISLVIEKSNRRIVFRIAYEIAGFEETAESAKCLKFCIVVFFP